MATIRRAGFGTVFELEDSKVGIGTDAATHTLQALGNIRSEGVQDVGITTLTTYQGFTDKETRFGQVTADKSQQLGTSSGEIVIDGETTVSSATTFTSGPQHLSVTDTFTVPLGDINSRELEPTVGSLRFNQDFATLEFYTGNNWATVNAFTDIPNSPGGSRGYIAGGHDGNEAYTNIDLIRISTLGNAVDFGDNSSGNSMRQNSGSASSRTRGFRMAGASDATILYFTLSTTGNAEDFGESNTTNSSAALASSTRAVTAEASNSSKMLEYIEMSTKANAIDFGDRSIATSELGAVSSATRGIFCGGGAPSGSNSRDEMDVILIASKGNATDFGNLTERRGQLGGGVSDGVRGAVAGGAHTPKFLKSIDYITFASNGNATHFGDLKLGRTEQAGATCNRVRGLFCGGNISPGAKTNSIEFITITSSGSGQDFGDLVTIRDRVGGGCISDSHGGLGGF